LKKKNINIVNKNIKSIIDANKKVRLEVNTENKVYVNVLSPESRTKVTT
jgi:hypothetical protein